MRLVRGRAGGLLSRWVAIRSGPTRWKLGSSGAHLFLERDVRFVNPRRIHLGESVVIGRGAILSASLNANLRIGDRVFVGVGVVISCGEAELTIGSHTAIGAYATIRNADHAMAPTQTFDSQPMVAKPIHIGNDVFIGDHATILRGVTIGDGAIVSANSLVTQDVPPYALVVGVPARVMGKRI